MATHISTGHEYIFAHLLSLLAYKKSAIKNLSTKPSSTLKMLNMWIFMSLLGLRLIEIKSRFEIARFRNRFIARFFSAPLPQPPAVCYRTNQNAGEQNRPGIQTDSMLKKQGRWVQNRIRTWWPKKCMLQRSYFLQSRERLSEDSATLSATAKRKMPLW